MGLNNTESMRLICDIETTPLVDVEQYLDPLELPPAPDLSLITAAKNLVDPVKVAADLEKRQQAALEAHRQECQQLEAKRRETIERCALDMDLCRIVAIGWIVEGDRDVSIATIDDQPEEFMLARFWRELGQRVTIGYNTIGFDLPILLRRSMYLGVNAPMLNLDKFRTPHIDLQQRLSLNGTKPYRSLNWYCRRFHLDVPEDANSGKDIGQLVSEGNWQAVAAHCKADVFKTRALAERMGVTRPLEVEALF